MVWKKSEYFTVDTSLLRLFEKQLKRKADLIAVSCEDIQLTYGCLNERANRLAAFLKNSGLKREQPVGILLNLPIWILESILATWKAGGISLLLNTDHPPEQLKNLLEDCQSPLLVTESSVIEQFDYWVSNDTTPQPGNLEVYKTAPRTQISNLDSLPVLDRSLVNYEKYHRFIGQAAVKHSISLQPTRGCPYHCLYCHKIWPKTHVFRSAEAIFDEVRFYYHLGVKRFVFVDDIFNFNQKNSSKFFQLVIENGLGIHMFFPNGMRGDIMSKDYIDLMMEAGTTGMPLALETASPRLQKVIGKNLNLDKLRENLEYICEKYPQFILELFTMHGFPTETKEEALMTLDFIKSLKWVHFPYINILIIYANTEMEKFALENGISKEAIYRSEVLGEHEFRGTLPFDKTFTLKYQTHLLRNYFLSKERLLHVLPYQMKVLTEDEIVQKYNSYLPTEINNFQHLLEVLTIGKDELGHQTCRPEEDFAVTHLNRQLQIHFPTTLSLENALMVLLVDLSQFFSIQRDIVYDVVEPPLGLMHLMTFLNREFAGKIKGKIAKSRIDFDNYTQLLDLLKRFKPDIIGIRTLTYYRDFFHETVGQIRNWRSHVPIIAGGPYATSSYKKILQDKHIDIVVLGEGEITFSKLVGKILENDGNLPDDEVLKSIAGIAFVPGKSSGQENLFGFSRRIITFEDIEKNLPRQPVKNGALFNQPADPAVILYPIGSKGLPEKTIMNHRDMMKRLQTAGGDLWQTVAPLINAAQTVIGPQQYVEDVSRENSTCSANPVDELEKSLAGWNESF